MAISDNTESILGKNGSNSKQILEDILKTLSLSFDKDMGMLNGDGIRNFPRDLKKLYKFKELIHNLDHNLQEAVDSDESQLNNVTETIIEDRSFKENEIEKKSKQETQSTKDNGEANILNKTELVQIEPQPLEDTSTGKNNTELVLGTNNDKVKIDKVKDDEAEDEDEDEDEKVTVNTKKRSMSDKYVSHSDKKDKTSNIPMADKDQDEDDNDEDEDDDEDGILVSKRRKILFDKDRMENDPQVKNPKSEFVISQTLPKAAALLGLFDEKKGLEATGEQYLKEKYAVASYPTNDLMEMLPGRMPDLDLSNPKPTNQIQFTTWLSYVEPFFRSFSEKDKEFLSEKYVIPHSLLKKYQKRNIKNAESLKKSFDSNNNTNTSNSDNQEDHYDPDITPFQIPKLGPAYSDVWFKEDNNQNIANITLPNLMHPESVLPKGSSGLLNDNVLDLDNKISCGPLASRLISAILKEGEGEIIEDENEERDFYDADDDDDDESDIIKEENEAFISSTATTPFEENDLMKQATIPFKWKLDNMAVSQNLEYMTFEEKLKQELRYVGIYMNDESEELDWVYGREDDEVCAELRQLQDQLRNVQKKNFKRKQVLKPIVDRYLAWQEYQHILDDLDKQVDQVYVKRIRAPKSKKKKHGVSITGVNGVSDGGNSSEFSNSTSQAAIQAAHQQAANQSLRGLIDKRKKWVKNIGPLFGEDPELMKRFPKESIFQDDIHNDKKGSLEDNDHLGNVDEDDEDDDDDVFNHNGNSKDVIEA